MSDKYLLLIVEGEWDEAEISAADFEAEMVKHRAFTDAVGAAGATVLAGEALHSRTQAFSVIPASGDIPAVYSDGTVADTDVAVSGYYVIETDTLELARRLAALCPTAGSIEVRPIWDMEM